MRKKRPSEPQLSTYLHAKGRRLGLPVGGNFELTARCNFNCPMCYVHMSAEEVTKKGRELSAEEWISIIRTAKDKGMIFALLTGGEPFVREDFFEIYDEMKKMGLMVCINSNGSMLRGEILEKLLENPPFRMNISLYGGCNETYEKMCGIPAFDKVSESIITLKEHGIDVTINLSITPYNYKDLPKIYKFAEENEIHVRASSYMYPPVRLEGTEMHCEKLNEYGNRFSPEDAAKWSVEWDKLRFTDEELKLRAEAMKNLIAVDDNECSVDMENGVKCRAGSTSFWMTWDGKMRPCGMLPGPTTYPLEVGFDKAWEQLREETAKIVTASKCSTCEKKELCGVCAAVCVTETGRFDGVPTYMCKKTEAVVKETIKYAE